MKFQCIDWYCWFIAFFVSGFVFLLFNFGFFGLEYIVVLPCFSLGGEGYFIFDYVGICLSVLSLFLCLTLFFISASLSIRCYIYVSLSVIASVLCYVSNNVFLFWWFYEVSILSLLFLIIVESPYSERYLAGWYLVGYVVLTSLPMLLCFVYFVSVSGSLLLSDWGLLYNGANGSLGNYISILLGFLFITKIPLPPFHVWLPIVHAESSSIVSICLSGYIMKLGLLGVCRFCWFMLSDIIFNFYYVSFVLFLSLLFFIAASWELDGKRWLALLSLSHIIVCMLCFFGSEYSSVGLLLLFSLGHGLSAGLVFVLIWLCSDLTGSRNWIILKSILGLSLNMRVLFCLGLCTVASLPPVLQFFVEVNLLGILGNISLLLFIFFSLCLFCGSLVPLFLFGFLFSRSSHISISGLGFSSFYTIMMLYVGVSFIIVFCL